MKILLVSPLRQVTGGIARWTRHVVDYYHKNRDNDLQLELFDTARSEFIPDDIAFLPRLRLALKDYSAIIIKFQRHLNQNHYDIIHVTSSASLGLLKDLLMIRLANRKGIKTLIHFRFGRIPQLSQAKNWEWKLLCRVVRKADRIIVLDGASYEVLQKAGFNNISLLPNPLSERVIEYVKVHNDVVRVPRTILFAGHCIRPKGVYELVKACNEIPNVQLKLFGAILDDVRQELTELYCGNGTLELLGERSYEEVLGEMMSCDVFVLPTYTEGFPNVIVEAMACGCAIVTTPVGAIPEMLEEVDGRHYGLMVEPKNARQLHNAIVKMLENESFKNECRENVKQRVSERYNMPIIWKSIVDIWNTIIE